MQQKKKSAMSDAQVEEAARLFGILSESSRLKLLRALMVGPRTVTELIQDTQMKQGNISKHLGVLLDARFVGREREGNFARYSIIDEKLYALCELVCSRIQNDARIRLKSLVG
ncbi:MAG: metalloregulator ArsR/SmtB family transcription factor [Methylacidiphilales bacterium]|nr:metalloregulator ArsR/SmtB family transcription factor [Candidatus Methylacidiphilales bacterium]